MATVALPCRTHGAPPWPGALPEVDVPAEHVRLVEVVDATGIGFHQVWGICPEDTPHLIKWAPEKRIRNALADVGVQVGSPTDVRNIYQDVVLQHTVARRAARDRHPAGRKLPLPQQWLGQCAPRTVDPAFVAWTLDVAAELAAFDSETGDLTGVALYQVQDVTALRATGRLAYAHALAAVPVGDAPETRRLLAASEAFLARTLGGRA